MNQCPNRVNYGAIAYAEHNGAYGFSYHYHSAAEANQHALSDCLAQGAGCKVVISFSETCAALAAGDNDRFAASLGDGRGEAQGNALLAAAGASTARSRLGPARVTSPTEGVKVRPS